MLGLITTCAPALIGSLLGLMLLGDKRPGLMGWPLVVLGIGGLLGFVLLGTSMSVADYAGISLLNSTFPIFLLSGLAAVSLICWIRRGQVVLSFGARGGEQLTSYTNVSWPLTLVLLANLAVVAVATLQGALLPLSSWDALGAWSHIPFRYIQYDAFGEVLDGVSRADGAAFPREHSRHPMTLFNVIAFSGYYMAEVRWLSGWVLPWSIAWLCGVTIIYGWTLSITRNPVSAGIASYVFCTIPLLENHATHAVGYAELWVALFILASGALSSLGLIERDRQLIFAGASLALVLVLFKNTGLLVAGVLLLTTFVFVLFSSWSSRTLLRSYLLVALALLVAASILLTLSVADGVATKQISYGGWTFDIVVYPLRDIVRNQIWALFANQSFSVLSCVLLFGLILLTTAEPYRFGRLGWCAAFLIASVIGLLFAYTAPQLIESFAKRYAEPTSDTGNSRFLLGVAPLLVMLSVLIFQINRRPSNFGK